ncbi:MAG: hypothetical protein VX981_03060, partial [Chloroflexota bacterium]|nr:hypothetical protein [Chloroflexota bacterium]
MHKLNSFIFIAIIVSVFVNIVAIFGEPDYRSEILYAAIIPSWVVYFLAAAVPISVVLSSLVTALLIRKSTPPRVEPINNAGNAVEMATPMVVPEPESTPKVAVEQPGRGPIPINVHEVPTTSPPNSEEPIFVPTISTFEVTENPTDLFFHEGSIWVASQDEDGIANYSMDGELIYSMPLHPYPNSLAHDGDELWVGTYFAVRTFDLKGGMGSAPVELRRPTDMLYAGDAMWIANSGRDVVTMVTKDRQTVKNIQSGAKPQKLTFDGQYIWVVNHGDDSISKIDQAGNLIGTWNTGGGARGITYGGGHIWVTNSLDDTLSKFTLEGSRVADYITGTLPGDVVYDGQGIWVANRTDKTVTKYGTEGNHLGTFHIGNTPNALATDGQGTVWAAHSAEGLVSKLVVEDVTIATYPVGNAPEPIIFDGDNLWVGNALSHTIMKIGLDGQQEAVYESHGREP